jgi:hypothetical protein
MDKKIIDKVMKLLALADGTNHTEEADSAKRMASELMAKHNIAAADLAGNDPFVSVRSDLSRKKPIPYDATLINIIAGFNDVAFLVGSGGSAAAYYMFIGKPGDVESTRYMIDCVVGQRTAAWKSHLAGAKKLGCKAKVVPYMNGFNAGLASKLRQLKNMRDAKIQEWGLVPVDQAKQALDWWKQSTGTSTRDAKHAKRSMSLAGYEAGKNAHINKGVGHQPSQRLALA